MLCKTFAWHEQACIQFCSLGSLRFNGKSNRNSTLFFLSTCLNYIQYTIREWQVVRVRFFIIFIMTCTQRDNGLQDLRYMNKVTCVLMGFYDHLRRLGFYLVPCASSRNRKGKFSKMVGSLQFNPWNKKICISVVRRNPTPGQLGGWGWSYPFSSGPGIFLYKMPDLSLQNGLPGNCFY